MHCFYKKNGSIFFLLMMFLSFSVSAQHQIQSSNPLERQFKNPPTSVKPYVWWHWMGSNFSKSGITKDLEAMKAQGIGGATIFNLTSAVQESHFPTLNNPWPKQTYRSPAYWEALRFAAAEAKRLGLEIGLHNTVGYSTTGGPWIDEERSMQRLIWSDTTVMGGSEIYIKLNAPKLIADEGWGKTGRTISLFRDVAVLAVPADKKEVNSNEVIHLTSTYDSIHGITWKAPAGNWKVYRICHASTGRPPHPIPDDLLGKVLEVDKMSAEQNNYHWKNVLDPIKEHLGDYLGQSFKHMLIDSYEAGGQNWTPNFRQEFINRKGYDPIPWLASFSTTVGTEKNSRDRRIINTQDQTDRFDWDYRDVISQLFFENGWVVGKNKLKESNLNLQMEPYGGPFNTAQSVTLTDLPMAEFWTAGIGGISPQVPASARAMGKTVVGAEAFTGRPEVSQYTEDPAFLKSTADRVFSQGINRMILHHWVHQPFDDKYQPGMGMGWWGTHFGRNQTWFEPGKAFFTYLARCQALLQYGEETADYLCVDKLVGHADLISTVDFLQQNIKIEKGQLILPTGRKYRFIVLSDTLMLPEVASKIKALVALGGNIVSPKPVKSPSLKNYPQCDQDVKMIADELWDNSTLGTYKKGYVFTRLEDAIKKAGMKEDFKVENISTPGDIKIAHRHAPDADIYFVSNQAEHPRVFDVSFNISNKQPELWQAENGSISNAPVWNYKDGRTSVNFHLKGIQSVFMVFRKSSSGKDHLSAVASSDTSKHWNIQMNKEDVPVLNTSADVDFKLSYASGKQKSIHVVGKTPTEITGPWNVLFNPKADQKFDMVFPQLVDFSKHASKSINYFAGTATYQKDILMDSLSLQERTILDLGEMNDIAEVRLNGESAGVLWYPPYKMDITDYVKAGKNTLEILVTNNWANRLIGDEQEPADFEWGKDRGEKMGRAMLAYPDWFVKNQPRPSQGRKTFSVWYYYRKDSPLKPAGLVGPVQLIRESNIKL